MKVAAGTWYDLLMFKQSSRDADVQEANELVSMYCDADCSYDEVLDLLVQNDIPRDVAEEVASDVRG